MQNNKNMENKETYCGATYLTYLCATSSSIPITSNSSGFDIAIIYKPIKLQSDKINLMIMSIQLNLIQKSQLSVRDIKLTASAAQAVIESSTNF